MILGKAREREQYEKQAKDGFFTAQPVFSTVSPAAAQPSKSHDDV